MIKTLQHLKRGITDTGCYTSDDFKKFVRTFRSEFKKEVAKIGGENVEIKGGHYYLYGFFTLNNQPYYIQYSPYSYYNEHLICFHKDHFNMKIDESDSAYKIFTELGFEWGGSWTTIKDYQHFEKNV